MVSAALSRETVFCFRHRFRSTRRLTGGHFRRGTNSVTTALAVQSSPVVFFATVGGRVRSTRALAALRTRLLQKWRSAAKTATGLELFTGHPRLRPAIN